MQNTDRIGMSEIHKIWESGGFGCCICRALSGFVSVSTLQTKADVLKTGNRGAGKCFGGFCRIIWNKWEICEESIGVNMKKVILCVMLAGIFSSSYAAGADQENVVDYSKLTDYPAQSINENNWHSPENIRQFSREFELKPTRMLARGETTFPLVTGEMQNVGEFQFHLPNEKPMTMNQAFEAASVDGYIVTKNGKIVYEKYFDGFKEHGFHSWYSGSKSLIGLALGHLVEQGKVDANKSPSFYLPQLRGSSFDRVTIRQTLNMTTAHNFKFEPNNMKPGGQMYEYLTRSGFVSPSHLVNGSSKDVRGIRAVLSLINPHPTIKPGEVFEYDNPNVDVIGWIIEEVSGVPLEVFVRENVWKNLQTEHDGLLVADPSYVSQASGGLVSTLRDHARFGLAVVNKGKLGNTQVFPEAWVQDTFNYSQENATSFQKHVDKSKAADKPDYSQNGTAKAYKNYWYIIDKNQKAMMSRGYAGQFSYVNQEKDVTITVFAGQTETQRPDADRLSYFSHLVAQRLK
jgi:CubicO group peptidase (beta-lactamase class C family)